MTWMPFLPANLQGHPAYKYLTPAIPNGSYGDLCDTSVFLVLSIILVLVLAAFSF